MSQNLTELVIVVSATFSGAVGYGDVFQCRVEKVISGGLSDDVITVTILAGDKSNHAFFAAHTDPAQIEIGAALVGRDAPYSMMTISGFVDKARNMWAISSVREASN